jgi:hypothetical protein
MVATQVGSSSPSSRGNGAGPFSSVLSTFQIARLASAPALIVPALSANAAQ